MGNNFQWHTDTEFDPLPDSSYQQIATDPDYWGELEERNAEWGVIFAYEVDDEWMIDIIFEPPAFDANFPHCYTPRLLESSRGVTPCGSQRSQINTQQSIEAE